MDRYINSMGSSTRKSISIGDTRDLKMDYISISVSRVEKSDSKNSRRFLLILTALFDKIIEVEVIDR